MRGSQAPVNAEWSIHHRETKTMTLEQLKAAVLKHVSTDWVEENFGDLDMIATWEDAYDRCAEFIASDADQF